MWVRLAGANFSTSNIGQLNKKYITITGNNIDFVGTEEILNSTYTRTISCISGSTITDVNNVYVYSNGARITTGVSVANNAVNLNLSSIQNSVIVNIVTTGASLPIRWNITSTITRGTVSGPTYITEGNNGQIIITPNTNCTLPLEITVNGVTGASGSVGCTWTYNSTSGTVTLRNVVNDITITARCVSTLRTQLVPAANWNGWADNTFTSVNSLQSQCQSQYYDLNNTVIKVGTSMIETGNYITGVGFILDFSDDAEYEITWGSNFRKFSFHNLDSDNHELLAGSTDATGWHTFVQTGVQSAGTVTISRNSLASLLSTAVTNGTYNAVALPANCNKVAFFLRLNISGTSDGAANHIAAFRQNVSVIKVG